MKIRAEFNATPLSIIKKQLNGNYLPNKFMAAFNMRFMPGGQRLTVKYVGSLNSVIRIFKRIRILEFTAVVGKNDKKQTLEDLCSQLFGKLIKNSPNTFLTSNTHLSM